MLLHQLKTTTDATWDKCWPVSTLRPLALLDLISYLFFIKKTSEEGLLNDLLPALPPGIAYPEDADELSWNRFKDLDARSMHHTFTKENGIIDLMKYYANAHLRYSDYFKAPLLITPSAVLLTNAVELVKIMEVTDEDTQGLMMEYLFGKSAITSHQGQVYIAEDISRLMVSLLKPSSEDTIWDPSAGNASLLINSAKYARNKNVKVDQNFTGDINTDLLTGMEADLVQLRIAAMNMMQHHIHTPQLKILNTFNQLHAITPKPAIIFSNLFFTGVESQMPASEKNTNPEPPRKEVALLQLILRNVPPGTRAAVLVPEVILSGNTLEIVKLREEIILRCNLEAVISMSPGNNPLFYGAAILVFNKNKTTSEDVWFAAITHHKEALNSTDVDFGTLDNSWNTTDENETNTILNLWNNRDKYSPPSENSFYIHADAITNNNFNLTFTANKQIWNKRDLLVKADGSVTQRTLAVETPVKHTNNLLLPRAPELVEEYGNPVAESEATITHEAEAQDDLLYTGLPQSQKTSRWKKPLLYALLVISIIGNIALFVFYNKSTPAVDDKNKPVTVVDKSTIPATNTTPTATHVITKPASENATTSAPAANKVTTPSQAIVTAKLPVNTADTKQTANETGKPIVKHSSKTTVESGSSDMPLEPDDHDASNSRYAVISKAFFYIRPNENSRITGEINSYDNGELVSSTEKNGFVYAIFYNKEGNNVSGWLSMKNLKLVQ
jgi:type I restriction-modification system DNA methylase subunit